MAEVYNGLVAQSPAELRQAVELYRRVQPRRVLEIGSLYGGTLQAWLEGDPDVVVAVDPNPRFDPAGLSERLTLIVGRSQEADVQQLLHERAPFDWIFIDGDHSMDAVMSDVELAFQLLNDNGGYILFHDIFPPEGWGPTPPGLVFESLRSSYRSLVFSAPRPEGYPQESANGIGVICV